MVNPQLSLVNFHKNAYIIVDGKMQPSSCFYIIRSGKVIINREIEVVEEQEGNILGPGDFFGVVSTMSSHYPIESARALTNVSLIAVAKEQYGLLIERNTPVAMKIVLSFSRKVRYLDEALTKITLKSSADNDSEHLFKVAEYYVKKNMYNFAFYVYHQYIRYYPSGLNIETAKQRYVKIKPYAKAVYLEGNDTEVTRFYPKGTMIFSESQPGRELFIIQKGSVKITKIVNNNEILIAVLKPGDIFGEMALLENKPRSASAIAYDDSQLMVVNKKNFQIMVSQQPQLITKLTQILAERIWLMYKQLETTLISDPIGKLFLSLLLQLEKNRVPISPVQKYEFNFGPAELMEIIGMKSEADTLEQQLFENTKLSVVNDKIVTKSTEEIYKQANYYKKIEKINNARKAAAKEQCSF